MALRLLVLMIFGCFQNARAQSILEGLVHSGGKPLEGISVHVEGSKQGTVTDAKGRFLISSLSPGGYKIHFSGTGYLSKTEPAWIDTGVTKIVVALQRNHDELDEVVVTGTMRPIQRMKSPVPVEVITPALFRKNPVPALFDAMGMLNGVQPQLNCNVCNTGDIHINGMEGAYTMVLIDGMPIVSALSTVYGLSGIPNSIVDRIEVVKGPGSSLYGSEAMAGIINVVTRNPDKAPRLSADIFATDWREFSADVAGKIKFGNHRGLIGVNYFHYDNPVDRNKDNFTDLTQQRRISVFNKWNLHRKSEAAFSLGLRYVYEDRWGGEMQWAPKWRGSDSIYGESIYTSRWEMMGLYQWKGREKFQTQFSFNHHRQNSFYGITPYKAEQQVAFVQTTWDKELGRNHQLLTGASLRYTIYDDNTPSTATADGFGNQPEKTPLPGLFVQDEFTLSQKHVLLGGYRIDYDKRHGLIHAPRLAWKYSPNKHHTLRASMGTGFRVMNLFTEDHAALTGAREVVVLEALRPERSVSVVLNHHWQAHVNEKHVTIDATAFYTRFSNKIIADLDSDPTKILYANLNGYAISRGVSLNMDGTVFSKLKVNLGVSYMDVFSTEEKGGIKHSKQQLHAPRWSGNFLAGTKFGKFTFDLTGKWNGKMRLPIVPGDFRPEYSPWHCIANLQITFKQNKNWELYGGIKNLFNFVPGHPILRPFDPFDKNAQDPVSNPHGYTFDPTYNYASLQGVRGFLGMRFSLK